MKKTCVIFGGFWFLYYATRSWLFSYDSLTNALEIEAIGFSDVRTPAHMLPTLLGTLVYKAFGWLGSPFRALYIVQQLNVLWGAVTVAVFYAILVPRFKQRVALLSSAALGFSYAFWSEVVDPGLYPLAGLGAVAAVGLILYGKECPSWVAGALSGCLLLVHQMFVFVLPGLVFSQWTIKTDRWRRLSHFGAGFLVAGILPFFLLMMKHRGSPAEMWHWLLSPPGQRPQDSILHHQFWSWELWKNIGRLWHSTIEGMIGPPIGPPVAFDLWSMLWQGVIFLGLVALLYRAFKRWPLDISNSEITALALWIGFVNLFQLVFAVGIVRYKILFLPAALTLVIGGLGRRVRYFVGPLAGIVALMGALNLWRALPLARTPDVNPNLARIAWVARNLGPDDFFLFSGQGPQSITNVAMRYFAPKIRARSVVGIMYEQYGHADFASLDEQIKSARSRSGHVYVESSLLSNPLLARWFQRFTKAETLQAPDLYSITKLVPRN